VTVYHVTFRLDKPNKQGDFDKRLDFKSHNEVKAMTLEEIIVELRARPSQTVPFAGMALGELQRGASYQAAKDNTLGVEVYWSGGKLRVTSVAIARRLGVEDKVTPAKGEQQAETTSPLAGIAPGIQLAAPKLAPARSRKAPAREATTQGQDRRKREAVARTASKSKEKAEIA
jgi:hypothetical protein